MLHLVRTKLRRCLLKRILAAKDKDFYVREFAALLGEDPGNCSRELKRFEVEGIIISNQRAGAKFYSLNLKYKQLSKIKSLIAKDRKKLKRPPVLFLCSTRLRRELLSFFIKNNREIYVRELATIIGQDPGNCSRELRMFEEEGVLSSYKRAKAKYYRLNANHELVGELREYLIGDLNNG